MLPNLFSSFDPGTRIIFSTSPYFFWVRTCIFTVFVSPLRFVADSRMKVLLGVLVSFRLDLIVRLKLQQIPGIGWVMAAAFCELVLVNLTGLLPWGFSLSSHLTFRLILALPFWVVAVTMTSRSAPWKKSARLIGTALPDELGPLVGLLETIRLIIRPITLGLRLAANMIAGHVILTLVMAKFMRALSLRLSSLIVLIILVGVSLFETAVCFVQAYVFILLVRLYISEWAKGGI